MTYDAPNYTRVHAMHIYAARVRRLTHDIHRDKPNITQDIGCGDELYMDVFACKMMGVCGLSKGLTRVQHVAHI